MIDITIEVINIAEVSIDLIDLEFSACAFAAGVVAVKVLSNSSSPQNGQDINTLVVVDFKHFRCMVFFS